MKYYSEATSRGGVVSGMLGFLKAPDFHPLSRLHGATAELFAVGRYTLYCTYGGEREREREESFDTVLCLLGAFALHIRHTGT